MPNHAFFNGQFVPFGEAKVSVMTHAFNYGTGCFEGIRAYWNQKDEQLYVFRLREHFERLTVPAVSFVFNCLTTRSNWERLRSSC